MAVASNPTAAAELVAQNANLKKQLAAAVMAEQSMRADLKELRHTLAGHLLESALASSPTRRPERRPDLTVSASSPTAARSSLAGALADAHRGRTRPKVPSPLLPPEGSDADDQAAGGASLGQRTTRSDGGEDDALAAAPSRPGSAPLASVEPAAAAVPGARPVSRASAGSHRAISTAASRFNVDLIRFLYGHTLAVASRTRRLAAHHSSCRPDAASAPASGALPLVLPPQFDVQSDASSLTPAELLQGTATVILALQQFLESLEPAAPQFDASVPPSAKLLFEPDVLMDCLRAVPSPSAAEEALVSLLRPPHSAAAPHGRPPTPAGGAGAGVGAGAGPARGATAAGAPADRGSMELAERLADRNAEISRDKAQRSMHVARLQAALQATGAAAAVESGVEAKAALVQRRHDLEVAIADEEAYINDLVEERELNFTLLMNAFARVDSLVKSVFGEQLYDRLLATSCMIEGLGPSEGGPLPVVVGKGHGGGSPMRPPALMTRSTGGRRRGTSSPLGSPSHGGLSPSVSLDAISFVTTGGSGGSPLSRGGRGRTTPVARWGKPGSLAKALATASAPQSPVANGSLPPVRPRTVSTAGGARNQDATAP